ncbi:hypothetical protein ABEF95_010093 [Exophiala dermatitidis]
MENSPASNPSTNSSRKSTQSGHLPGTPKPPFDPPRRRSSLFFTRVLQYSQSPKTPSRGSSNLAENPQSASGLPTSSIARKRLTSPLTRSVAMPGHVAQMQRLFQTAKASLRLDVRYASSPSGAIDSRLPTSPEEESAGSTDSCIQSVKAESETLSKEWRYSRAPRLLAEFDIDVREPFPDASPQLPELLSVGTDQRGAEVAEPPSSGFTSPADRPELDHRESDDIVLPSSMDQTVSTDGANAQDDNSRLSASALEGPLTDLRVSSEEDMDVDLTDDSPIVNLLNRRSREIVVHRQTSPKVKENITLSAPAKAAADSARVKRGMLSDLFSKHQPRTESDIDVSSSGSGDSSKPAMTPCPDPLLHERGPVVLCPNPGLHYGSCTPSSFAYSGATPSPNMQHHHGHHQHAMHSVIPQPPMPFNRATATGSPMPILKVKSPPVSPGRMRNRPHDAWNDAQQVAQRQHPRHHREQLNREFLHRDFLPRSAENFRPGWYYARENSPALKPPGPAMYSFSTAAAKVVGHDPAPDSRIRDSYRTDTLTPLARPPTRFRKNGIIALASARGVGKYYATPAYRPRPSSRSSHSRPVHLPDSQRFMSSPPRSFADSSRITYPRKRSRELDTPSIDPLEDVAERERPVDPKLTLEEGEEIIEVDEATRAAVRMSLYGAATLDEPNSAGRSMKELNPNVVAGRKGTRSSAGRKKRRPSYWDGDLEEVVQSPAARHVVSSPVKKDDVRSQQAEVEFEEDSGVGGIPMTDGEIIVGDLGVVEDRTEAGEDTKKWG